MSSVAMTQPAWIAWDEIQREGSCIRCGEVFCAEENESTRHATERVFSQHKTCLPDDAERKERERARQEQRDKSVKIRLVESPEDPLSKIGSAGKHVVAWAAARLRGLLPDRDAIRSMFSLVADEKWIGHFDPSVRERHARALLALAEFSDFVADKYEVSSKLKSGTVPWPRDASSLLSGFKKELVTSNQFIDKARADAKDFFSSKAAVAAREGKPPAEWGPPWNQGYKEGYDDAIHQYVNAGAALPAALDDGSGASVALSLDPQRWRQPVSLNASPRKDTSVVPFAERMVPNGETVVMFFQTNEPFQPTRFSIPKRIASFLTVMRLDIGSRLILEGSIPGDSFEPTSEMGEVAMPMIHPDGLVRLSIRNDHHAPILVQASFYGFYPCRGSEVY